MDAHDEAARVWLRHWTDDGVLLVGAESELAALLRKAATTTSAQRVDYAGLAKEVCLSHFGGTDCEACKHVTAALERVAADAAKVERDRSRDRHALEVAALTKINARQTDLVVAAEAKAEEQRLSSDTGWERVHKLENEIKALRDQVPK